MRKLKSVTKFYQHDKNEVGKFKYEIIEELWKLIISDKSVDEYESNLMKNLRLDLFSDKIGGEIKLKF